MIKLSQDEKKYLRLFFAKHNEWIITHSLQNDENIRTLINMYGEFIAENNLIYSRNLLLFIMELKEEELHARCARKYKRLDPHNLTLKIDSAVVKKWKIMSGETQVKKSDPAEINYDELNNKIFAQHERIRKQNIKQKIIKTEVIG